MSEVQPTITSGFAPANRELDTLCRLIREEKVILWVGSGFSCYAGYPSGSELCSLLLSSIGELPEGGIVTDSVSLQDAADCYVQKNGREELNQFLVEQFGKDPVHQDIHEALALINRIKYVVTTNYDPLFEHAYRDRIIVVSHDEDLPGLSEYPEKTILLKIHGDVTDPDNLIITSEDYKKFDSKSIVWSKLRSLFAEKSVVFIGYSLQDPNVKKMLGDLYGRLKGKNHPYFFVSRKIDEKKRADFADYDLHFIEMDAISAIGYITGNAIQYAYLDSMKNPALFSKMDPVFDHKGFRVDRNISGGKLDHVSLVPTRPDVHTTFTLSLSPKPESKIKVQAFYDVVSGRSFDSVELTPLDSQIRLKNAEINGVLTYDPSHNEMGTVRVTPQPREIVSVDFHLQNTLVRLSNVEMKIFGSPVLVKFEVQDPDFTFSLSANFEIHETSVQFSGQNVVQNIDRARILYSVIDGWLQGGTLELLWGAPVKCVVIPSSKIINNPADRQQIHGLYCLYTDLSDIQAIFNVKLQLPAEISPNDYKTIQEVARLVRGGHQSLKNVSTRFGNSELNRPLLLKDKIGPMEVSGIWENFTLFGADIRVPFKVIVEDAFLKNKDEIVAAISRGDKDLKIKWGSTTGKMYRKYVPPSATQALTTSSEVQP